MPESFIPAISIAPIIIEDRFTLVIAPTSLYNGPVDPEIAQFPAS
jgi:hypothetical protein